MGYEVTKMPLPAHLGVGPKYDPEANKKEGFKRGPVKKKFDNKKSFGPKPRPKS